MKEETGVNGLVTRPFPVYTSRFQTVLGFKAEPLRRRIVDNIVVSSVAMKSVMG